MILVVAVVLGIHYFQTKNAPPPTSTQAPSTAPQPPYTPAPVAQAAAQSAAKPTIPTVQAAAEQTTVVENDLYRITFSNRGAQATSWVLK